MRQGVLPHGVGLREATRVTDGHLVVVEDHYPQGGLGAAVMEALAAEGSPTSSWTPPASDAITSSP